LSFFSTHPGNFFTKNTSFYTSKIKQTKTNCCFFTGAKNCKIIQQKLPSKTIAFAGMFVLAKKLFITKILTNQKILFCAFFGR
jgi:hypothetical protein